MRLLLVADLHYSLPQFDWVFSVADGFDVVVMAGDHLDLGSSVDRRAQAIVVGKYFERLRAKTTLLVCSGNHDLDAHNEANEKTARWLLGAQTGVLSDGELVLIDDTLFTMCPWWDGPVARSALGAQLEAAASRERRRWIWIHHAPPAGSPVSWGGARYFGDVELRQWIERYHPDFVFSGHVHQSPFVTDGSWVDRIGDTWVFNTGQHPGVPPAHVIIDTDEGEALWFSAAGSQFVRLDQPLVRPVARLNGLPAWLKDEDRSPRQSPPQIPPAAGG